MLYCTFKYNARVNRRQAVIYHGNTPVAIMETYGIEGNLEEFKKYLEKAMKAYGASMNTISSGEIVKIYNPKKIIGFEYSINGAGTAARLGYKGVVFAHLNVSGISSNMDIVLRYIYRVAQGYLKYLGVDTTRI